jgi:hypothetical protein
VDGILVGEHELAVRVERGEVHVNAPDGLTVHRSARPPLSAGFSDGR